MFYYMQEIFLKIFTNLNLISQNLLSAVKWSKHWNLDILTLGFPTKPTILNKMVTFFNANIDF